MIERLRHRLRMTALAGRGRECPCCGSRWRRFASFRGRPDSLCLRCGSLERHRALALLLALRPELSSGRSILHFAPEPSLRRLLEPAAGSYTSTDIDPEGVDVAADISDLPFEDGAYGLIVCSHVLEHVPDDAAALAELARVLGAGGTLIVMVPLEDASGQTDEEPTLTDPAERRRRFGQDDHVRRYGRDLVGRIEASGLAVESVSIGDVAGVEAERLNALRQSDAIFLARHQAAAV